MVYEYLEQDIKGWLDEYIVYGLLDCSIVTCMYIYILASRSVEQRHFLA